MQTQEEINADAIARLEKEIVRYYEIANHLMDIRNKLELKRASVKRVKRLMREGKSVVQQLPSKGQ